MKILDVVALTEPLPDKELERGQVGTIVENLAPHIYEVEFSDVEGRAYASLAVSEGQLMLLHHSKPSEAA